MISCLTTRCAKRGEKRKKMGQKKRFIHQTRTAIDTVIGTTLPVYQEVPKKTRGNMT